MNDYKDLTDAEYWDIFEEMTCNMSSEERDEYLMDCDD